MTAREARRSAAAAAVALATTFGGCFGGGTPPMTHYYTLTPPGAAPSAAPAASAEGLAVGVESFAVDPPYDQDRLVYRKGPDSPEVGFYAYRRWAAPLDRLLAVSLARGLGATPGIARIEPAAAGGGYDAVLTGRLLYLEEVDRPGDQEVRMALELELAGAGGEALWSDTLTAVARGTAGSGDEVMRLVDRALADLLRQAREGLACALAAPAGDR